MTASPTGPSPALTPAEVVLAQLAALRCEPAGRGPAGADAARRDPSSRDLAGGEPVESGPGEVDPEPGEGVALAWAYASPGNREATGPLARFAGMLRADAYRGLLGHRTASLGPLVQQGDRAQVEVLVLTADDSTQGYTWVLGRQARGTLEGCWLTDGVVRHPEVRG